MNHMQGNIPSSRIVRGFAGFGWRFLFMGKASAFFCNYTNNGKEQDITRHNTEGN